MNKKFNYEISKILKNAEKEMFSLNHPYVGTEHLLLSLLKCDSISNVTSKYGLTYKVFKDELISVVGKSNIKSTVVLYTPLLKLVIDNAINSIGDDDILNETDLFISLLSSDDGIALRVLMGLKIDVDILLKQFVSNDVKTLDSIGINLNECVKSTLIGRDKEINNIFEILLRKVKNNPVLIGDAGVGKSAIVYEVANRIKNGNVPRKLLNKKIISVDMATLLSNTKYRGEFETKMNNIVKEVMNNKDIILFIDEIHTLIKSGGSDGSIDAANILKPYLADGSISLIGATTTNEYEKFIESDKALSRRFERVYIKEPSLEETKDILKGVKRSYQDYHNVMISDDNINDIVNLSNEYIKFNHNPDRALDVLDCVCSRVNINDSNGLLLKEMEDSLKNKKYDKALSIKKKINSESVSTISRKDILSVIESIGNIRIINNDIVNNLIHKLDADIKGQNISELKSILINNIGNNNVFGFLLVGNEHVGKRYTAKVISDALNYNFIELNMKDYNYQMAINKLLGSDNYNEMSIFDKIKYNPSSVILFNSIEYANSRIIDLIKDILNDGYVKNNKNELISFNNCIIIMTTNVNRSTIGFNYSNKFINFVDNIIYYDLIDKKSINDYLLENNIDTNLINDKTDFKEINKLKVYNKV